MKTKTKKQPIDRKDHGIGVLFEPQMHKGLDFYGEKKTYLRFLNDEQEEMGCLQLSPASESWIYFTPADDPDQVYGWHASQLRAIADKLDELNGE